MLLVLAAHAQVPNLYGGFIGVDIFFVISGYLITGIIKTEIEKMGTIDLMGFYVRRLKRLLPALMCMLVTTSIGIMVLAPAAEQPAQSAAAASAALWASNLYFIFAEKNYFAISTMDNAFLHTWSLGVEEQFYLVWPVFILLLVHFRVRMQFMLLGAVTLLSLLLCVWIAKNHPVTSFYLMPTRIWQFGAGAVAWLISSKRPVRSAKASFGCLLFGALGMISSILIITENTVYPGWLSVFPTLASVALILATTCTTGTPFLLPLQQGLLRYIGDRSYSIYLWHWPALVIGEILVEETTFYSRCAQVACGLLLAHLSYRFIETPFRHRPFGRFSMRTQMLTALALITVTSYMLTVWHRDASSALKLQETTALGLARSDKPRIYKDACDDWYISATLKVCRYGDEHAPRVAVVWGDSIGLQWFPAIWKLLEIGNKEWRLEVLTKSGCPIVNIPLFYKRLGRVYTECTEWRENATSYIRNLHPDLLFIGSAGTYNLTSEDWSKGSTDILNEVSSATAQIVLIAPTYKLAFDGIQCIEKFEALRDNGNNKCTSGMSDGKVEGAIKGLTLASRAGTNTSLLDMNDSVCPQGRCSAIHNNIIVYRDNQHLTASFVEGLAAVLQEKLQPTLSKYPHHESAE